MIKEFVRILGCGSSQGVPKMDGSWGDCKKHKKNIRTRCSIFVKINKSKFIIDTSPDIRSQFLKNKIYDIDFALFTHAHADHILGINELRTFYLKYKEKFNIYLTKHTEKSLKKMFKYLFVNQKNYPAVLKSNILKKKNKIKNIKIETIKVSHGTMQTIGFKINKFAYIPDFKKIEKTELKKLKSLDVLIIDCFRYRPHNTHVNFAECLEYIKLINPKRAYLTNMYHEVDYFKLKTKIKNNKIFPCYDGLKIKI